MLGSEFIADYLTRKHIDRVYTFPGGTLAPLYDAIKNAGIEIFCACHEQGAGYAALAVARLNNSPEVVMVTSGPGVTNLMTVVADAYFDSTPLVVITGQVGTADLLSGRPVRQRGFQQVDTTALMSSICKKVFLPLSPDDLPEIMEEAFALTIEGRPGPVVVDMPMDVQRIAFTKPMGNDSKKAHLPPVCEIDHGKILKAVEWILEAQKPTILAGQGVLISQATESLRELAHLMEIPVVTSLLGLGAFPTEDPLSLGFMGHTGNQYAGNAVYASDLLITIGARLDIRQTGTMVKDFIPEGRIIRIDVDDAELEFSRVKTDLNIRSDAKSALEQLLVLLKNKTKSDHGVWLGRIKRFRMDEALHYDSDCPSIKPQKIIETANRVTEGKNVVVVTGVGSHQQWAARHFDFDFPHRVLLTSGGHGAMGYDLPSAVGAQMARPDDQVLCFVGDGSLQINIQELQTVVNYNLPVKIIVMDNKRLAMVSQFQLLNWGDDPTTGNKKNPDFASVAAAYGIKSFRITDKDNVEKILLAALNFNGPALVHCMVDSMEEVVPMLLPNQTLDKMWKNE
jgi:acetolactate synthase I/II/III large subunit